jgi:hypothetical protein
LSNGSNNKGYINIGLDCSDKERIKELADKEGDLPGPYCKRIILRSLNSDNGNGENKHLTLPNLKHILFYIMGVALFTFLVVISTIYLTLWAYISMVG